MPNIRNPEWPLHDHLEDLSTGFVAACGRGNPAECANFYTEDAIVLYPGGVITSGRAALEAAYQEFFGNGGGITALTTFKSEFNGSLGFAAQTVHSAGPDRTVMLALRREPDGQWRVCMQAVVGSA
ncbi:hypothetical protein BH10PSE7_BH10PSE7_02710 [soil metagenome]